MVSWNSLFVCYVLCATIRAFDTSEIAENYSYNDFSVLIKGFLNVSLSSKVIVTRNGQFNGLDVSTEYVKLIKHLSRDNIYFMATRMSDIKKDIAHHGDRFGRVFLIVIIESEADYQTFAKITSSDNVNLYRTLVIFTKRMDVCNKPFKNNFNLAFNTRMLVKCYDSPVIREWYSLFPNKTETFDLYEAHPNSSDITYLSRWSFHGRRNSLKGLSMRTTIMEDSVSPERKMIGLFGSVFAEIANMANITVSIQSQVKMSGSRDLITKKWNGVVGKLYNGEADVGVGGMSVTNERLDAITFTKPLTISTNRFYLRHPEKYHLQWSMYYKAFGLRTIGCLVSFLVASPILIAFIQRKVEGTNFLISIRDNYFYVWGIFCNVTHTESSRRSSLRVAFYSLYILSFLLYAAYSALLVSYLTVYEPELPFNSLEEFENARTHKIITLKNSIYYAEFRNCEKAYMQKYSSFLLKDEDLPGDLPDAMEQVCNERKKLILFIGEKLLLKKKWKPPCDLVSFDSYMYSTSVSLALTKGSQYLGLINYYLQKMREFGLLKAIEHRDQREQESSPNNYKSVDLDCLVLLFGILLCGIFSSLLILFWEKMIYRKERACRKVMQVTRLNLRLR